MNKNYPSVAEYLRKQIEEKFTAKTAEFRREFRSELLNWFQTTYKEILSIKKDDELRNKRVVDTLNKNISDLNNVIENYGENQWSDHWNTLINDLTEQLPETVVEYQSEERFEAKEEDSFRLKSLKALKRGLRIVSAPFKKDKKGWKQVIQLRKSIRLKLTGISGLPEDLLAEEFKVMADALAKLLEKEPEKKIDKEEGGKNKAEGDENKNSKPPKVDEQKAGYKFLVLEKIETHLQEAISILKKVEPDDSVLQRVMDECYNIAVKSGTVEENRKLLEPDYYEAKLASKKLSLQKLQNDWLIYLKSQYSDFAIQIEIARFAFLADNAKGEILNFTHRFFRDYCYLPLEKGVTKIKEIADRLKEQTSEKLSSKLVEELRSDISEELSEKLMKEMTGEKDQRHIINQIQKTITDLQLGFYNFTDQFTLAEKRSIEGNKPLVTTDTVNWKKLATRYVQENALREMDPEKREWETFLKEIISETEEAIQIVDVNLLTAKESEKDKEEDQSVLEIAISGAERAVNQLEAAIKKVRERQNSYENVVKVKFPGAIQTLAETMLARSYTELELQDKALQVKAKAYSWQEKGERFYYKILEKGELIRRFAVLKLKEVRKFAAKYLGFSEEGAAVSTTEKRNLAEYLAQVDVHLNFPFVYKRLFSSDFDIDNRFYTPPVGLFTLFEQSYEDWTLNIDTNFLVVGERGSGKTLALKVLKQKFLKDQKINTVHFDQTIYTEKELLKLFCEAFGFDNTENRDELIQKIRRKKKRSILIVEDIQNTFVRNIHGFEAIESFWVIMTSTSDQLFWMVTCSAFAWNYFVKVFSADQYFSHTVRTDMLDREAIEKSILSRHKATGYELKFEAGAATQKSRSYRKLMSDDKDIQSYLHEQYFNRLDKIAEGNMSIAMIFWLQSIKEFDDKYVTQLPTEIADVDKLEVPSREVLFTLSALVLHEFLTEEEVSFALHQDLSDSRLMLARLKSKGIVQNTEHGYNLNHLVYRQIVRLLKRRNIIH